MAGSARSLRTYLLTRLALVVPMVLILLTVVFLLMRVIPGDPISVAIGEKLSAQELQQRRHEAGFDRPLIVQYGKYLGDVFSGKFGTTFTDRRPVSDVIKENGGATLELTVGALIVAFVIGLPLGLLAGRFRDTWFDAGSRLFGIVTYAAPVFFVGLLLQLFIGVHLGLLPTSQQASPEVLFDVPTHTHILLLDAAIHGSWHDFWDVLKHLIMPAFTLGLVITGVFIRLVRVNIIQTLRGDYIEAARARGVPERQVVVRHAFRNALVPVVTVMGLQAALLLSGAVLTEETFSWPGIGYTLIRYLNERDYTAVQGIITVFALVVVVVSLLIDIINALVDPRIRY